MKIIALLLSITAAGMTVVSGFIAMFSPMAMDAPGSEKSTALRAFVYLMFASPVAFLIADIIAWIQFGSPNYGAAALWAAVGFVPFLAAFVALFLGGK